MNRFPALAAIAAAMLLAVSLFAQTSVSANAPTRLVLVEPGSPELNTGQIIVRFTPAATAAEQASLHASLNGRLIRSIDALDLQLIQVPNAATAQLAAAYASNPLVSFAEVDAIVPLADLPAIPNDAYYFLQWQHDAIDSPEAWATETGAASTLITICDTGVSATHPDLIGNLRGDLGRNTANGGSDWSPIHYHGTSVAGAAAAVGNNEIGVSGVAQTAGIVPVRVSDRRDGAASLSALADCISYGAEIGSASINVSYTTYSSGGVSPTILAAANYANNLGSVTVIAAGNSNQDAAPSDDPESILYVAATNSSNGKASFSNYGVSVDIAAPGESVVTTYSEVFCRGRSCSTGIEDYAWVSGTSFAAPIVAGAIALASDAHGSSLDGASLAGFLRDTITDGACDLGDLGEDVIFGAGLLNVHAAVHGTSCTNEIPAPTVDAILVSPILASVYVGGTQQFAASAIWSDGNITDVSGDATWSSSDPSVATIDGSGIATGAAVGMAGIVANLADLGLSGSTLLSVTEAPAAGTIATVPSIEYSLSGGPTKDRNLGITVAVADDLGSVVEGAQIELWLQNVSTGQLWTGTATTGADGTATLTLRRAPSGVYTSTIMSVAVGGLTWDGQTPANGIEKQ